MTPTPSGRAVHVDLAGALARGAPPEGNLAVPIFAHGSLAAEMYSPRGEDRQRPHARDEGLFFDGSERHPVRAGSFIFVPALQEHRFERFTPDFALWVFFYGPEGGDAGGEA